MILIDKLRESFHSQADEKIAREKSAYLKGLFSFVGLPKPLRDSLQKPLFQQHPVRSEEELEELILALWEMHEREFQYAALDLAQKYHKLISEKSFPLIETLIRTKSWWDSVDLLAGNSLGKLLQKHPHLQEKMETWIDDPDRWIRRSALLFQLKYKQRTNEERLFRFCKKRMGETEFFIRKAIGWVLREYSKTHPSSVRAFVEEHKTQLSGLSYREASKYL